MISSLRAWVSNFEFKNNLKTFKSLNSSRFWYVLFALFVVAMGLFNIKGLEVGRDEGVHGYTAKILAEDGVYGLKTSKGYLKFDRRIGVGPTVIVPTAFIIKLFGVGIWQLRLIPLLYFLGFILTYYYLVKRHVDFKVAVISTILILSSQWPIDRDNALFIPIYRTFTGESGALFFLTLALVFWDKFFNDKRSIFNLLLGFLFAGLSILTKLQFTLIFPAFILALFILDKGAQKRLSKYQLFLFSFLIPLPLILWFGIQLFGIGKSEFMELALQYKNFSNQTFLLSFNRIKQNIIDKWFWLNPPALKIYFTLPAIIYGWVLYKKVEIKKSFFITFSLVFSSLWMFWYIFSRGYIRYEIPGLYLSLVFLGLYISKAKDLFIKSMAFIIIIFGFYINFRESKVIEEKNSLSTAVYIEKLPSDKSIETLELDYSVDYFLKAKTLYHVSLDNVGGVGEPKSICYESKFNYILTKKFDPTFDCALKKGVWNLVFESGPYKLYSNNN